jgi:kumamolisin
VIQFAKANGLAVVSTSRNRMNIDVIAPVANIEKALHITMSVYQHPTENRTFYAPDREPTVELPFALCRIAGLDNYSIPRPPTTMLLTPAQAGTRRPDPARLPPS